MKFTKLLTVALCATSLNTFAEKTKTVELHIGYVKTTCVANQDYSEVQCQTEGDISADPKDSLRKVELTELIDENGTKVGFMGTYQTVGPAASVSLSELNIDGKTIAFATPLFSDLPVVNSTNTGSVSGDTNFTDLSFSSLYRWTQTPNADQTTTIVNESVYFVGTRVVKAFQGALLGHNQNTKAMIMKNFAPKKALK